MVVPYDFWPPPHGSDHKWRRSRYQSELFGRTELGMQASSTLVQMDSSFVNAMKLHVNYTDVFELWYCIKLLNTGTGIKITVDDSLTFGYPLSITCKMYLPYIYFAKLQMKMLGCSSCAIGLDSKKAVRIVSKCSMLRALRFTGLRLI